MNKYLYKSLMFIWTIFICPIIALLVYLFATLIFIAIHILKIIIKPKYKTIKNAKT
jgi:hypothetical protein